jgi:hypothetical protein
MSRRGISTYPFLFFLIIGMARKTLKKDLLWPHKYYRGLTRKKALERKKEIQKFGSKDWKDPKAYVGFKTDVGVKVKPSSYTSRFKKLFPEALSLEEKAKATGVPVKFLKESYDRGLAAWRTGHRPGASQQAWGYARTSSFLLKGKTYYTADADIARRAIKESASAKKWFSS